MHGTRPFQPDPIQGLAPFPCFAWYSSRNCPLVLFCWKPQGGGANGAYLSDDLAMISSKGQVTLTQQSGQWDQKRCKTPPPFSCGNQCGSAAAAPGRAEGGAGRGKTPARRTSAAPRTTGQRFPDPEPARGLALLTAVVSSMASTPVLRVEIERITRNISPSLLRAMNSRGQGNLPVARSMVSCRCPLLLLSRALPRTAHFGSYTGKPPALLLLTRARWSSPRPHPSPRQVPRAFPGAGPARGPHPPRGGDRPPDARGLALLLAGASVIHTAQGITSSDQYALQRILMDVDTAQQGPAGSVSPLHTAATGVRTSDPFPNATLWWQNHHGAQRSA